MTRTGPAPDQQMIAVLKAASCVRDGTWVSGAPTHVFAEFLKALEAEGWQLVRLDDAMIDRAAGVIHAMFCAPNCPESPEKWRENARMVLVEALG